VDARHDLHTARKRMYSVKKTARPEAAGDLRRKIRYRVIVLRAGPSPSCERPRTLACDQVSGSREG
jgi:ethanolamine ammonia-lyase small subunit